MIRGQLGSLMAIAGLGLAGAATGCGGDAFTAGAEPDGAVVGTPDGAPGDAPIAAPIDAGAGWCATQLAAHTFCEDFLHGVPDKLVGISANAMILADTTDYFSAPQSMAAITPKLTMKNDVATALATHDFSTTTGTQFTLDSYFKIASSCFPGNGSVDPVTVAVVQFPEANYGIALEVAPGGVTLLEIATGADGGITSSPQQKTFSANNLFDSWQVWTLTIDGGIPKFVTLTVGGATVIPQTPLKGAVTSLLQHPTLFLGASVKNDQNLSPGCKVNLDDILVDVRALATAARSVSSPPL
jgi:hypothetical protein